MRGAYFGQKSLRQSTHCLNFGQLQNRLISFVTWRIRSGEFTERALARVLGVSQPHLQNVLKGVRPLKPEFADSLLRQFEITVLDLLDLAELKEQIDSCEATWATLLLEGHEAGILSSEKEVRKKPKRATLSRSQAEELAS
jgi:transcriptional regulator with XRE-family HTH domain